MECPWRIAAQRPKTTTANSRSEETVGPSAKGPPKKSSRKDRLHVRDIGTHRVNDCLMSAFSVISCANRSVFCANSCLPHVRHGRTAARHGRTARPHQGHEDIQAAWTPDACAAPVAGAFVRLGWQVGGLGRRPGGELGVMDV